MLAKSLGALVGLAAMANGAAAAASADSANPPKFSYGNPSPNYPGVQSTAKNGPTNPKAPQLNTPINQQSDARLVSINSVTDWCTFGPPGNDQPIGNVEGETVAYCTQPRNNARVIPDGTITGAHFVKTPLYVQIMASGDFTKIGLVAGDEGGELDPHGATEMGNPVGGNVTSNVSGKDVFYEEWMNYISYNQVCFRICIAGSDQAPTSLECQHTLDEMGCNWVMPGNYQDNMFETCDGDAAYPPGIYPQGDGSTSTFQQFFTGQYVVDGKTMAFTNGAADQVTPTAAYSTPATSNCVTTDTIKNGIASLVKSSSSSTAKAAGATGAGMSTSKKAAAASATGSGSSGSSTGSSSGALSSHQLLGPALLFVAGLFAAVAVL
ncbi:uncharacterized protein PFL1_01156 [Pseudozyma flocculosa PF-1]|uniref:88 kDa immunoreactive mannoprotein MP88 n=1 Tax=Pseudozyma flocculosa TaxID=84751 RepID=A0A5C3EVM8_9BASI|nr:uncharacterized protein PFL1_01156 [Pseudozyma flocculosa PF-1]EPQ30967.1 hypothetical protein PFL1_01156 [Pseudozyma flocculosa PF-1]SPO35805.1 uncharacterized protein PSFLO_01276 [Pseudozyma flocculosa]